MKKDGRNGKRLRAIVRRDRKRFEEELRRLVEIPTVSALPDYREEIGRGASEAAKLLANSGANARIVETKGNPVVVGEFLGDPAWPWLTIYNHLDVQPADPAAWRTAPFSFKALRGVYYGRGATDDKGPALTALMAARAARALRIPLNIRFLWETEEEIGSPSFAGFLAKERKALPTGSVLVSDTIWVSRDHPSISYGLRGLQVASLRLETGSRDLHSGLVGGLARNPVAELCEVVAQLVDGKSGRVKIPGFYDKVRKPTAAEVKSFRKSGFSLAAFRKAHGLRKLRKANQGEAVRRIWTMPTLEIHGVRGGYGGPGVKTIVPHAAEVSLSMRIVPDMTPSETFRLLAAFVKKKHPEVRVKRGAALPPFLGSFGGPYADAAREALQGAFGTEPAFIREGGSIGPVLAMEKAWKCPVVLMGLSLPDHGYHSIDEYFDWKMAEGGAVAMADYMANVSRIR